MLPRKQGVVTLLQKYEAKEASGSYVLRLFNVHCYTYQKFANRLNGKVPKTGLDGTVVIFDEAHNLTAEKRRDTAVKVKLCRDELLEHLTDVDELKYDREEWQDASTPMLEQEYKKVSKPDLLDATIALKKAYDDLEAAKDCQILLATATTCRVRLVRDWEASQPVTTT